MVEQNPYNNTIILTVNETKTLYLQKYWDKYMAVEYCFKVIGELPNFRQFCDMKYILIYCKINDSPQHNKKQLSLCNHL